VSDAKNQYKQPVVFNLRDESIVPYAVFPELPQFRTMQRPSHATRVVQFGKTFIKKF
jgi:hypothetical protein